ncbi:uncharacterized protein LOC123655006 [Melitaea cinxia]|uniref:uncharacterized protein LOC123655006 n=1 Tax=Melitaea cinxia TaxID=113334 RepID=UPI001E270232|nr:uncharacterized protein LOC123655006 [Melitaea cinxia]XP_045446811.1 uncharacterized protein LOC123655006 [Melitaea cinxia]XP_045446812.1 uncharacterized protein LOC123655006 [Melitaea cinxia]XP_045446813.1 uncharacterized protein LOC123655006 [Melitaea cinxia]
MVKVILLMFVCFALAAFATANKLLSHEESPKPETNNIVEAGVTQTQLRSLEVILGELHQAIGTILEHDMMYDQKRVIEDSYRQTFRIGKGSSNINYETVKNHCQD